MTRLLFISVLIAALVGCAAPSKRPAATQVARVTRGALPTHWRAVGRVAVKQAGEGWSAHFDWQQVDERAEVHVQGPLGAGAVLVTLTPGHVRIESASKPPQEWDAPEDALASDRQQPLGWGVPMAALPYWMMGVPELAVPSIDREGGFEQRQWQVRPTERTRVGGADIELPTRLEMSHGDTRLRWVIDQWQVGTP